MAEPRVLRMEGQRHERLKAAGLILQLAETQQMVDAVVIVLDVAVEHRAVRAQSEFVRRAVDVEPFGGVRLVLADPTAHVRMKDLRPAARHAAQTGTPADPRGSRARTAA